jgi:TolB-like protein/class 3 adenylate cyclase/Tfp pilus assembly protein PilF
MPRTRQLAAIMFTDIQGYTAMMQHDEELTIKIRDRHRKIFNSTTEQYKGTILQYFGDGTLSTFKSAIDAVKCAMEMQMAFQQEPVIPVRIGIHLGDIVFTEDDIIGDGVNVASRIESLAVPGSVFISDKVYDEIKNQPSIKTQSLRTFELKNVDRPIEVFAISNKGLVIPNADEISGKTKDTKPASEKTPEKEQLKVRKKKLSWILYSIIGVLVLVAGYFVYQNIFRPDLKINDLDKSIAVLAFKNISNDPNQEYFSDGISEEILNSLVKVKGLKVAGRTSSFSFKGKAADIQTIGSKLGVSLVLEGSVRKSENRVRITAKLINVADGYHIWSEQYDRELKDIFAIQEEIASKIVNMLKLTVLKSEESKQPTNNIEAYDFYLKGVYSLMRDVEGTVDALNYFKKAIELDPEFALAYAGKGDAYLNYAAYGIIPGDEALLEARKAAKKSISLDSKQAYGHKVLAHVHLFYDWDWKAAKSEYLKAVELGHPDPDYFIILYEALLYGNYDNAIRDAKKIVERNPLALEAHMHLGYCYLMDEQYENAIASFKHTLKLDSSYNEGHRLLGKTYRIMGRYDESLIELNKTLEMTDGKGPALYEIIITLARSGRMTEANIKLNELLKLLEGQYIDPGVLAGVYANLGRFDETFSLLEACFEERNEILVYLKMLTRFDLIRHDPRYKKIIERMSFPD